jgi:ubiquinone/menaquinone biosynthesis C-methylase UbiE
VELVEISGYDLSGVADASVDVVYCTVMFMHLESWDRYNYISEAFRALRAGGRIYVDNINLCSDGGWKVFENSPRILTRKSSAAYDAELHPTRDRDVPNTSWFRRRADSHGR